MLTSSPGLEAFLIRTIPGLSKLWVGAMPWQIQRIEAIAGRPLPTFYHWFLSSMGASMGPLTMGTLDFSAERILSCYDDGVVPRDPRYLLIGYECDSLDAEHYFYDLDSPCGDDAGIVSRALDDENTDIRWESLHELLGRNACLHHAVRRSQAWCEGRFLVEGADLFDVLDPAMDSLGFTRPVRCGRFCRIYEHEAATPMACYSPPSEGPVRSMFFDLGGSDATTLRRILGTIASRSPLTIEVLAWEPPLP